MAFDFLLGSRTYRERLTTTHQMVRHAVCAYLGDSYHVPRGRGREIAAELNIDEGIVYPCIRTYKKAFDYLTGSDEVKSRHVRSLDKFNEKYRSSDLFGIWCLFIDGIKTLEEIQEEAKQKIVLLERVVSPAQKETLFAEQTVAETIPNEKPVSTPVPTNVVPGEILSMLDSIQSAFRELCNVRLEIENTLLASQLENEKLKQENEYLKLRFSRMNAEIETIKEMKLEELAETFPRAGRLYALMQEMHEKTKERNEYEQMLPRIADWPEGEIMIEYIPKFREQFRNFNGREQSRIVSAIQRITASPEAVREQHSFNTIKMNRILPGTPHEYLKSRASNELRFCWKKEHSVIYFYVVFRKGDRDYISSES